MEIRCDLIVDVAVEELHCMPLIMDIRTFGSKAMNNTLPYIDYVINLNNGTINISVLGVVPSICNFLNIPCIPCDATTMSMWRNKEYQILSQIMLD